MYCRHVMRANIYEAILSVCNTQLCAIRKHQTAAKGYSVNRFFIMQKVLYKRNHEGFIVFNTVLLICTQFTELQL